MPKITKRFVDTLTPDPKGKEVFIWDDAMTGFGIRMKASGTASYLIQYRTAEGRTRRMVLGKVGTLTPDEARKLAAEKLGAVAKGADPSGERHTARSAPTVADVCAWYLQTAEAGHLLGRHNRPIKQWTLYQDRSRINAHVLPLLGSRRVNSLTSDDIRDFINAIVSGKSAKVRSSGRGNETTGGRGAASRCAGMLRTIFAHALREYPDRKHLRGNLFDGVKLPAAGKQRRFLALDELTSLGRAMREAESEGENKIGIAAVRLLLLTGLRRNEALALPWAWVDSRAHCIRFEDTKSGAQLRPIGGEAVRLLDALCRRPNCPWVFPADRGDGHFVGLPRVLDRLCERAGLEGVTVHVLRHSFAAAAAEMGFSELTIAGMLGHTVTSVTGRYAHIPDSTLVATADRVAARIATALGG